MNIVNLWPKKWDEKKSKFWLFVILHGRHFENGLTEAIYTQSVAILVFGPFWMIKLFFTSEMDSA